MAAGFPAKTSFADGNALSAAELNDLGGTINKIYNATYYPNQLSLTSVSDSVLRPLPFATSTDKIYYGTNIGSGAAASITVTFGRSSRFTQNPIVTATAEVTGTGPVSAVCSTSSVTTSGFSARFFNVGANTITDTYLHYIAMQMTSLNADNN
jgi:hypothetical protein